HRQRNVNASTCSVEALSSGAGEAWIPRAVISPAKMRSSTSSTRVVTPSAALSRAASHDARIVGRTIRSTTSNAIAATLHAMHGAERQIRAIGARRRDAVGIVAPPVGIELARSLPVARQPMDDVGRDDDERALGHVIAAQLRLALRVAPEQRIARIEPQSLF